MDEKIPVGLLIAISIWFWVDHGNLTDRISYLEGENSSLEDDLSSNRDALEQANSNIEDAKSYAWSSYSDMGDALDYLETVEP